MSERDNTLITPGGGSEDVISDYSNVPYDNMEYKFINDVGKQWIKKYTYSCKIWSRWRCKNSRLSQMQYQFAKQGKKRHSIDR